jgi:hypothetical protein
MIITSTAYIIYGLLVSFGLGFATGQAQRPDRAEIKACAIDEIKTNNVTAEEAIMRCR